MEFRSNSWKFPETIKYAAKKSKIYSPKILYYPILEEDFLSGLVEKLDENSKTDASISNTELPELLLEYYSQLKKLEAMKGIQMRLPYDMMIK